jgi:hypothetical protein
VGGQPAAQLRGHRIDLEVVRVDQPARAHPTHAQCGPGSASRAAGPDPRPRAGRRPVSAPRTLQAPDTPAPSTPTQRDQLGPVPDRFPRFPHRSRGPGMPSGVDPSAGDQQDPRLLAGRS